MAPVVTCISPPASGTGINLLAALLSEKGVQVEAKGQESPLGLFFISPGKPALPVPCSPLGVNTRPRVTSL